MQSALVSCMRLFESQLAKSDGLSLHPTANRRGSAADLDFSTSVAPEPNL